MKNGAPPDARLHAVVVDHVSALGGAEFSLEALIANMPSTQWRYTVALPGPGAFTNRLREGGFRVVEIPLESWRWWTRNRRHTATFVLTLPLQVASLWRWLRLFRAERPDIVHLNVSRIIEPLIAARLLGIPVVMHFRDIPRRQSTRFVLGWAAFFRLMNLADAWVANSHATADDIRSHCRRTLFVVPNGLDVAFFDRARREDDCRAATILVPVTHHVAMIAGLNAWKRQEDFISVAARVLRMRSDVAFYLVGADIQPAYVEALRRMVRAAGIEERVRFVGFIDTVPSFIDKLDLIVHTTPYEPFGRVFLEAMAGERPVVAFASGGAAEIIVNNETGVLVPGGELDRMAAEVIALLDDEPRRRRLGCAARRHLEAHYTVERHCGAIAAVYAAVAHAA
jgi:glycosyltransferase involved in cell wall biosynthesis